MIKDSGACLLVVHVCRTVYRGCPCRDPPMCLDAQGGIKAKRQPFLWLLECGLVDVSCVRSHTCST